MSEASHQISKQPISHTIPLLIQTNYLHWRVLARCAALLPLQLCFGVCAMQPFGPLRCLLLAVLGVLAQADEPIVLKPGEAEAGLSEALSPFAICLRQAGKSQKMMEPRHDS